MKAAINKTIQTKNQFIGCTSIRRLIIFSILPAVHFVFCRFQQHSGQEKTKQAHYRNGNKIRDVNPNDIRVTHDGTPLRAAVARSAPDSK
jgi:hypothetical protein